MWLKERGGNEAAKLGKGALVAGLEAKQKTHVRIETAACVLPWDTPWGLHARDIFVLRRKAKVYDNLQQAQSLEVKSNTSWKGIAWTRKFEIGFKAFPGYALQILQSNATSA